jgi:hypothetical protein
MKTLLRFLSLMLAAASIATLSARAADGQKIGVYESRAVALAWGRSTQHDILSRQRMEQAKRAEAAGDKAELRRLRKEGSGAQERLEKQVFGNDRIPDVIERVQDQIPAVQQQAGVASIVDRRDAPANAPTVDVTSNLVALFQPTDKTLKMIEDVLKHPPVKRIPKH